MAEFLDTFLSFLSPATILGAAVFSYDKRQVVHPINVHTFMIVITWLAELGALWMAFLMSSLLYEHTQKNDDDSSLNMNKWFYFSRATFVSLIVVINLVGGISMNSGKWIQQVLCGGTFYAENDTKSYKGAALKYVYAVLETAFQLLPLVGTLMINDRISKYSGVCTDDGKLDWDVALENKDYNLGQYYGWMLTFYGIAMGIRLIRSLVFGLIYGAEKNNIISHPSFTDAKSMLQVRQRLQKIDENMKLEKDILSNARYEVTYNLEKRQSGVDGPFRKDLTL